MKTRDLHDCLILVVREMLATEGELFVHVKLLSFLQAPEKISEYDFFMILITYCIYSSSVFKITEQRNSARVLNTVDRTASSSNLANVRDIRSFDTVVRSKEDKISERLSEYPRYPGSELTGFLSQKHRKNHVNE